VGLHIGFRGINVTLKGTPENQLNQTINYNEEFSWEFSQGLTGHGIYAIRIAQEVRKGQHRGLPYPILRVAEWFTWDGETTFYGRYYRTAGWFGHILLWIAFTSWGLTIILFAIHPRYGALGLSGTGIVMLLANIVWTSIKNKIELAIKIPFPDGFIELSYGWCWYLNLITGIASVLIGVALFIGIKISNRANSFFFLEDDKHKKVPDTNLVEMKDAVTFDISDEKVKKKVTIEAYTDLDQDNTPKTQEEIKPEEDVKTKKKKRVSMAVNEDTIAALTPNVDDVSLKRKE